MVKGDFYGSNILCIIADKHVLYFVSETPQGEEKCDWEVRS